MCDKRSVFVTEWRRNTYRRWQNVDWTRGFLSWENLQTSTAPSNRSCSGVTSLNNVCQSDLGFTPGETMLPKSFVQFKWCLTVVMITVSHSHTLTRALWSTVVFHTNCSWNIVTTFYKFNVSYCSLLKSFIACNKLDIRPVKETSLTLWVLCILQNFSLPQEMVRCLEGWAGGRDIN